MGDEDRDAILKRRNRLVALAFAGLASTAGCDDPGPASCLSPPPEQRLVDPTPTPCLQPPTIPPVPEPFPQACLSPADLDPTMGGVPTVCLSVALPPDPQEPGPDDAP